MSTSNDWDIAIVGMAGRFPGAPTLDQFWQNLARGVESIARFSDEEILDAGVPATLLENPAYVKAAPVIDEPGAFDAAFFGFVPMEARTMDPQHRILLELAHEALENAGYGSAGARGAARVGVFTGSALNTYVTNAGLYRRLGEDYIPTLIGNDKDFLSTRISYKLNLRGPSLTVQTACSTSLVALHLACQSLRSEESDMALAGAVSVRVPHRAGYLADAGGVVSPDGRVRAFDAQANGTVFGSGGGIVVLKRLADALADGDTIRAVIKGSAVNNDGSAKAGYTAPSVDSQADAVVEALANAGVEADSIGYIEAHGSGTPVGDPIEMRALTKAFRTFTTRAGYCALGSVKTNVGHLDAAAGIAGVIKTVLALEHRQLPPSLHYSTPNPEIDFPATPFFVNTALREWTSDGGGPRRAGVMATGMGGTNAHVVLEEAPVVPAEATDAERPQLLVWSAKTEAALDRATEQLRAYLSADKSARMSDVAHTLQVGRAAFAHRRFLVAAGREAPDFTRAVSGRAGAGRRPVILLLPGVGDHYVGMGYDLYEAWPTFREEVDRCVALFQPILGRDIRDVLYPKGGSWKNRPATKGIDLRRMLGKGDDDPDAATLNQTLLAQPALFTIEYATARLWQSLGITPDAIVGHSMGEYVAACLAGVMSLQDATRLVATRAKLANDLPQGAMLAVTLAEDELRPMLSADLSISLINGPKLCVVAGPAAAVAQFETQLGERKIISRRVANAHAFHSRMIEPIVPALEQEFAKVRLNPPAIPYVSNVTGTWITADQATSPAYWATHATRTARFSDALGALWRQKDAILLEAGPGRTLGVLAMQHPDRQSGGDAVVLSSLRHVYEGQSDVEFFLNAVGRVWASGLEVKWDALPASGPRRRVPLPTYPFERQVHWLVNPGATPRGEPAPPRGDPGAWPRGPRPVDDWFYVPTWERTPFPTESPAKQKDGPLWLVIGDRLVAGSVKTQLDARGLESVEVRAEELEELEDYVQLFRALGARAQRGINIVHLNQKSGFYSLLHIAQALGELNLTVPVKLGVISNGLHEVTGEERIDPEKATLLGPVGVIPREYPNITCFNVDLPGDLAELPDALLAEFAAAQSGSVVAYRGRYRWKRGYQKVSLPAAEPRLKTGGVYLITGGTGGLGLAVSKYLAATCKPTLVLTKQTQARSPKTIQAIQDIEALGARVEVMVAEASDREQMQAVVAGILQKYGAIDGVIHAAGIVRAGVIQAKTKEAAARVMAPKVDGTLILYDLLRAAKPDFLVLFSSITTVSTPYAEVDYVAANAFLDAFTHFANAEGRCRTLTINWPGWKEVGQLADLETLPGVESWKQAALERAITTADGVEAFKRALSSGLPQVIVSPQGIDELLAQAAEPFDPAAYLRPRRRQGAAAQGDALQQIWCDVLGLDLDQVGEDAQFADLGGHSLLAMQIVAQIRSSYQIDFTLRDFFDAPTIAESRALIEGRVAAPALTEPAIPRRAERGVAPLSSIQRQMWVIDQMTPGNPAYNLPAAYRLLGNLDVGKLERSCNEIIRRHDALRTTFTVQGGEPQQQVHPELAVAIRVVALDHLKGEEREARLQALASEAAVTPFDLSRLPLIRVTLFKLGASEHVLLINVHHIVVDGMSFGLLLNELDTLYRAERPTELPVQYGDFAHWQRETQAESAPPGEIDYWRSQLGGTLAPLELPTDRPRPAAQSFAGSNVWFTIPPALTRQLAELGGRAGCTPFMTMLAAFQVLLERHAGVDDIIIGTPIAERSRSELQPLIGNFLNMVALRGDLAGDPTFAQVLRQSHDTTVNALSNAAVPFETVLRQVKFERDASRNPVFQVMLQLLAAPAPKIGNLAVTNFHFDPRIAQFDLSLHLYEEGAGYQGRFEYCTDLFERETVERLTARFEQLLRAALENPERRISELVLLPGAERQLIEHEWNDTAAEVPAGKLIHELFEAQVARAPARTALVAGATSLSYAELDARANRVAHSLRSRGIGRGARVGLSLERGSDMLAALLGILKSGAAYVPLDPAFPAQRLRFMADDAKLALLLDSVDLLAAPLGARVNSRLGTAAESRPVADGLGLGIEGEDPAYLIYTSGSTGTPKGVAVPHRAVVNFLTSMAREPGLAADDVLVAVTTLSFDIAVLELLLPLTVGATVVIASRDDAMDGQALRSLLEKHRSTVMQATPVTWRLLLEAGWKPRTPFRALVGGEALPQDLAQQLIDCGVELWNMYGPTETTVWSTCARITDAARITIGKPIANTTVRVLDARGELSPIGVPGELCIGGAGVALGYWNRPDLTAERFIAGLYHTGDRVRWRGDGTLEHLGRFDDQVKVRGFRIELGEIEAAIAGCPGVREVVVVARQEPPGEKRLVAYVVGAPDGAESIRARIRTVLPEYMVPSRFVMLDALPRTNNGKIDRKALPAPEAAAPGKSAVAPSTPTEAMVLGVFRGVLGHNDFGADGNFFDLGGDSLMAARMVLRLRALSGADVPLRVLFERQTVAGMAEAIDALKWLAASERPVAAAAVVGGAGRERVEIEL